MPSVNHHRSLRVLPGLLALAILSPAAGCFVDSLDPDQAALIAVSVRPPGALAAANGSDDPWNRYVDDQGNFLLSKFGKYVRVSLDHRTQGYELGSGTWPSQALGIGSGEGPVGQVDVEFKVPPGSNGRLRGLGFVVETTLKRVVVYQETKPVELELVGAEVRDVELKLELHPTGTVSATIKCQAAAGRWVPKQLALVDARAEVVHPAQALTPSADGLSFTVAILGVPVGRPHRARIVLQKVGDPTQLSTKTISEPTFTVSTANDTAAVSLDPCNLIE